MRLDRYPSISIGHVEVTPMPGSELNANLIDAVRLAADEWKNVTLIHNGRRYRINCNDLLLVPKEDKAP